MFIVEYCPQYLDDSISQFRVVIDGRCGFVLDCYHGKLVGRQAHGHGLTRGYSFYPFKQRTTCFIRIGAYRQLQIYLIRDDIVFRAAVN